jgi:hypothetical protein
LTKSRYGVRTEFADPKVAKRFRQAILQVLARISQQHQDLVVNKGGLKSGQRFGRDSFGNRSKSQEISVGAGKVLQYDTDPRRSAPRIGARKSRFRGALQEASFTGNSALADHHRARSHPC